MKDLIGTRLGQYEIREKVGQGGMAHVYKAYQSSLDRFVAIKVLAPTLAEQPGFTARFQREAHSVARLHHPNILPVFDFGVEDNHNYIVTRYVENSTTLRDLIQQNVPVDRLIEYLIQVADALHFAHEHGIIHRDVKPSNVLIDDRWALLSDFGLVKMAEGSSELTGTGMSIGTPAYMSPEQATGKPVDHRTDIYALGIILYKILTGTIPHDAQTPIATMIKRSTEPVPPLREITPTVTTSLEHVTLRTLAREPDGRYGSAAEFKTALDKARSDPSYTEPTVINQEPPTLPSTPVTPPPLPAPGKRNTGLIYGGLAAVVLILAVLAFLAYAFLFSDDGTPQAQASPTLNTTPAGAIVVGLGEKTPTATPVPPTDTPTPIPRGTPSALVLARLAVHSGPGEVYDLLGYLPEGAEAVIIGQDESRTWWRIRTPLTVEGVGWIEANPEAVETRFANAMPIALAPPSPTPTATSTLSPTETPTPTETSAATNTPSPTPTATRATAAAVAPPPTATPTLKPEAVTVYPPPPEGKALFVFFNNNNNDWNLDVGTNFFQVPGNQLGKAYSFVIDPGTYTWAGRTQSGEFDAADQSFNRSFEFTVQAGQIYQTSVSFCGHENFQGRLLSFCRVDESRILSEPALVTPTPVATIPPTATPAQATTSDEGFEVPAGKALFVFYNFNNRDWAINVGPHFLEVPANKPGQPYEVRTVAIDPGTYDWHGNELAEGYWVGDDNGNKSFRFTVAAGQVYKASTHDCTRYTFSGRDFRYCRVGSGP